MRALESSPAPHCSLIANLEDNWDVGQKTHCTVGTTAESAKLLVSPSLDGGQAKISAHLPLTKIYQKDPF
jgi:hypothetical protein